MKRACKEPSGQKTIRSLIETLTAPLDVRGETGDPRNVFVLIQWLKIEGASEEIQAKIDHLPANLDTNPLTSYQYDERLAVSVRNVEKDLKWKLGISKMIENFLPLDGLKFNPETRTVERITGGRPSSHFAEVVWARYSEKHRNEGNTVRVRKEIAEYLSLYFSPEELDPRSGGGIDNALKNRLNRGR